MSFLSREEAARTLRVSTSTLDSMARRGEGPPIVRISGRVFYDDGDLREWVAAQRRPPALRVMA